MPTHANNPLIAVHPDTKKRLDALGKKGQTYNDIIVELLDIIDADNPHKGRKYQNETLPRL